LFAQCAKAVSHCVAHNSILSFPVGTAGRAAFYAFLWPNRKQCVIVADRYIVPKKEGKKQRLPVENILFTIASVENHTTDG
jgi:hypothetical protein